MKLLAAIIAFTLTGCATLPIKGRVCYQGFCAESDGESLTLTGYVK